MTLEQLRVFIAVAEREHMTAAAQALHMTQSAVSSCWTRNSSDGGWWSFFARGAGCGCAG